jgi:hypothetical protein
MLHCAHRHGILCALSRSREAWFTAVRTPTAVNQRGACNDFIDLRFILEHTGLTLECLQKDLGRKYAVGDHLFFQLRKSLVYFDDAERDLNVNTYTSDSGRFERLADDTWLATKRYFRNMVMAGSRDH